MSVYDDPKWNEVADLEVVMPEVNLPMDALCALRDYMEGIVGRVVDPDWVRPIVTKDKVVYDVYYHTMQVDQLRRLFPTRKIMKWVDDREGIYQGSKYYVVRIPGKEEC